MGIRKPKILKKETYYMQQRYINYRIQKYGKVKKCEWCGKEIPAEEWTEYQARNLSAGRKFYCDNGECAKMSQRRRLSELRKTNNPMDNPVYKQKAMDTKKKNGWQPIWIENPDLRGGNGRFTKPQKILWKKLNEVSKGWEMEQPVSLGEWEPGYPKNYKLDIGNSYHKIGIECDGDSHNSAKIKAKDRKKEKKLEELGWRVLRFSNSEILKDSDSIVTQIMSIV